MSDAIKPHEIEKQLKLQQQKQYEYEGNLDGRPRDHGDMLEALKREHGHDCPDGLRRDLWTSKK